MLKAAQKGQLYCRGYELGDLDRLVAGSRREAEVQDLLAAAQAGLVGWTVTRGPLVVACAFIQMLAKDHANIAAMVDQGLGGKDWAVITRFVRAKFKHLAAAGVVKITATVRRDMPLAPAYLARFGFVGDDSFEEIPGYLTLTRSVG